ncbi:hypothetical protein EOL70_13545 [Leucothrix sargassi]|nr:hypothetical protein EOL70_13545 [Leucothrix sargassi]
MKDTGIVYTPQYIAEFIVNRVKSKFSEKKTIKVLEPSCGEGVFIPLVHSTFYDKKIELDVVEIDPSACKGLEHYVSSSHVNQLHNEDFISFETQQKYDLIIGNPPYISRKYLNPDKRSLLDNFSEKHLFSKSRKLQNTWSAFILKSTDYLDEDGVLAFLLPAEVLQVAHAQEIQNYLLEVYNRVEILYFNQMIFDNAEQDAILLIASRAEVLESERGLFISDVTTIDNKVVCKESRKFEEIIPNKWTSHILTSYESSLLSRYYKDFKSLGSYITSSPGIVTAANSYFIVSQDTVNQYKLEKYTKPIIKNGRYVNGEVSLTNQHWELLADKNSPCHFLDFSDQPLDEHAELYLEQGIMQSIEQRYKCRNRKEWYSVPSVWSAEAVFFKRSHLYPKLIHNADKLLVTDSAYRVTANENYDITSVIYSFYNSLTMAFSEIIGRSFAGGLLELTPKEFKATPLPYTEISNDEFEQYKELFLKKGDISDILTDSNSLILKEKHGVPQKDIETIEGIRLKLLNKRFKRPAV